MEDDESQIIIKKWMMANIVNPKCNLPKNKNIGELHNKIQVKDSLRQYYCVESLF